MGHHDTSIVPFRLGVANKAGYLKNSVGGEHVSSALAICANSVKPISYHTPQEKEAINHIKELTSYVAVDYEKELEKYANAHLPRALTNNGSAGWISTASSDRSTLTLTTERFRATEIYFQPQLFDSESSRIPLHQLIAQSIGNLDANKRSLYSQNIVLAGGGSLIPGMAERLKKELSPLVSTPVDIQCYAHREIATWLGGVHLSGLSTFQKEWIDKQDYDEMGPSIVHGRRKCW